MLRLIQCEFLKLKRKRLFQAAFLTTFIMPVLYSLLLSDSSFDDLMSVIRIFASDPSDRCPGGKSVF